MCFRLRPLALWLAIAALGAPGLARAEDGSSPAALADDALQRCWAVKMGMSLEEVNRLLGTHLPMGWVTPVVEGKYFPCTFRIKNFGVYEIQIGDRRAAPPHEAMFAAELRRGIAAWGQPDWIDFSENKLRWDAAWNAGKRDSRMFTIELEPTKMPFFNNKNGSFISYFMTQ